MSMNTVMSGFQQVHTGMSEGSFTEHELLFIIQLCEAVIRDTRKVLGQETCKMQNTVPAEILAVGVASDSLNPVTL